MHLLRKFLKAIQLRFIFQFPHDHQKEWPFPFEYRADGYAEGPIGTAEWVLRWFAEFCREEEVGDVGDDAVVDFCARRFGFDAGDAKLPMQTALRKPLLTAMELYRTGSYCKTHQPGVVHEVPECMRGVYSLVITDFVGEQREISLKTKERKIWIAAKFLTFVAELGVGDIARTTDRKSVV